MGGGHIFHNWESYEGFTYCVLNDMRPFLFGYHISFCYFFALEVVRGHEFWTHLETCMELLDLLPLTLTNGIVNGKMRS